MDHEEYKRKALEPIVNYIESVMASYSKEELEARIKKALPEMESEDERIRKAISAAICGTTAETVLEANGAKLVDALAYLEKQKEQPEVDLEKEVIRYKVPFSDEREYLNETTLDAIARHFYELGLNARKL